METPLQERHIYEYFVVSVLLKGLVSLAEVVAGVVVLFISPSTITDFFLSIAGDELAESDFIGKYLTQYAHDFALSSGTFVAVYLLSRGIVKLILVWALLKNQLWAYPWSLVVLSAFVLYQLYQITTTHSIALVLLTLFDLLVMYFIWREWRVVREHTALHTPLSQ